MAVCDLCDQEMTTAASCSVSELHRHGEPTPLAVHRRRDGSAGSGRCGDCGVEPGGLHHIGCDLQRCPRCRGQLIFCDCGWDELAWEADDDDVDVPPTVTPPGLVPFTAAAAPLRARHHAVLVSLAEVGLATGRPIDTASAALVLELVERRKERDQLRLTRPDVLHLLRNDSWNWCAFVDTSLPDDWAEQVWRTLTLLSETHRLDARSDPLPALLEPLRCIGGLDADGRPRPPGEPTGLACQCFHAHDPACPSGHVQRTVGADEQGPMVAYVLAPEDLDAVPVRVLGPLHRLARRLRAERCAWEVHADEFAFHGNVRPTGRAPLLSLFHFILDERSSWDPLALDSDGEVWVPTRDARCKRGFRWTRASAYAGLSRCGLVAARLRQAEEDLDLQRLDER